MIISPLTPRSSGCSSRADKPRQSITMPSRSSGVGIAVELDGAAGGFDAGMQFGQHRSRLDMALVGIEQAVAETAFQRRFEIAQAPRVEPADGRW